MRSPLKTAGLLLPLVFVQAGIPAFAANPPPNVSSQVQIAEKRMQETAEKGLVTPKRKPVIEKEKEPEKAPEEIPELRFPVTRIEVDGNQAVSSEELRGLVAPYENKEQSMRELTELAQRIEEYYAQKGFITSVAYIPAQKSADGVFRIQVVEGKTGEILVEGNRYSRTRRIRSYIRIPRGKILRYRDIEKSINKLNQNADREVQAVLKKGEKPETTDIVFKVRDRFPLHAGFLNDNQGSEPSGKQRVGFFLRDSNVTGFDDALFTGTIFGKHFGSVFTQYLFPVATTGTRLSAGFSHSQVDPQKYLKAYGVNGTSQNYYGMIDQRLISAGRFTLDFAAKMEFKESRTKVLSGTNYRERLRLLRAGPYAHLEDRWGFTDANFELSGGIDGLGAAVYTDPAGGRQGVGPGFMIFRNDLSRTHRLPMNARLVFQSHLQFGTEKLPSSEALYLGGGTTIRGYPEGDYMADGGFYANLEYLIPSIFFPKTWYLPFMKEPLQKQVECVAFVDEGYGRQRGSAPSDIRSRHLMGVGGGLRIHVWANLFARTEWAMATGAHPLTDSGRYQFHFRLQAEI